MKRVCVIGLGQFGGHMARTLVKLGCEVIAIDTSAQRVDDVRDEVHRALIGDARDAQVLGGVIGDGVDEAIVSLGKDNIEPSILSTLNLKRLEVPVIRSTARNDDHALILRAVGATEVIYPERQTAERTARRIAYPNLRDMFSLDDDYRILEVDAPKSAFGKTLSQLDLRRKFELLVLAVREPGAERFSFLPQPDAVIKPNSVLMILGRELDLARFAGQ